MKIACFECDTEEERALKEQLHEHELTFFNHALTHEDIQKIGCADALVVFIYSQVTREIIERLPFLKLIVTRSTGYDHIDLNTCRNHGITVCNVPKYGGTAVAEHTFALMLALTRNIPQAVSRTNHDDFSVEGLAGSELAGKTLGIIGAGTIGSAVARRAKAFDMNVITHERTPNKKVEKELGTRAVSLKELFQQADIISLHVPHTAETHHLINKTAFKQMKPHALLINTARGGLIDTKALYAALTTRQIAGAALDVLEGESELKEAHQPTKSHYHREHDWSTLRNAHRLLKLPNVIVTPHMAFYTHESLHTILNATTHNIEAFARGTPSNVV